MPLTNPAKCKHGCDALLCTDPVCTQGTHARARLIHACNATTQGAALRLRSFLPTTNNKRKRVAYCEHYPQGIARCQRCKAKAREEVLKIMLEQNGDQHLCPFLYK